ncbi:MAG: hypothetical protein L6Q77_09215 [Bacteroidetes bacterium]|nr:hypothetical protein [Bacteroidota bacterium]
MKKIFSLVSPLLFVTFSLSAQTGPVASFHFGFPLSGTNVGYQFGNLVPYAGIDLIRLSWDDNSENEYYSTDYQSHKLYLATKRDQSSNGSVLLVIPKVGARFYFSTGETGSIAWYVKGDVMKIIPSFEGENRSSYISYLPNGTINYQGSSKSKMTNEEKERQADMIDYWGFTIGTGVEYFFSNKFALGGEYGIRLFLNEYKDDHDETFGDSYYQYRDKSSDEVSNALNLSYTEVTLNYYFGRE